MDPDLGRLDAFLHDAGHDGYLIDGADADATYLSGFDAPDPFVTLYADDAVHLLVSGLEFGRAKRTSRAASVRRLGEFDHRERVEREGRAAARSGTIAAFLDDHGVSEVAVPDRFPVLLADGLRERGVAVEPEADGVVEATRAVKTDAEVDHVREAQRATEAAIGRAERLLRDATVGGDGGLHHEGESLTSERVKRTIEHELVERDCALADTIVAGGADAADPHDRGSGPLRVDEPIVVDVFPRSKATGYHADTTRTFVVGDPDPTVREFHETTLAAQAAAFDAIEPGVTGAAAHDAVCDVYEAAGHETLRSDETADTGFVHGTGHGVGLEIHERPRLSLDADDELEPGHVVTVEPGLYDPDVGGVRIEDLVVVREGGFENLTDYPTALVLD
jgi:Xaa-Pro aminopeptidase